MKAILPSEACKDKVLRRAGRHGAEDSSPCWQTSGRPKQTMEAILPSEACKDNVLRRLQEMKAVGVDDKHSPIHNLRISSDQTKKQREEYNNLKAEIDRRTAAGEHNLVIRHGRIFTKQPFRAAGKKAKAG